MDSKLLLYRKKIDKIDSKIIKLLKERFDSAKQIGNYKRKKGIKIIDEKREDEILKARIINSKFSRAFTKKLFSLIIKESRRMQ